MNNMQTGIPYNFSPVNGLEMAQMPQSRFALTQNQSAFVNGVPNYFTGVDAGRYPYSQQPFPIIDGPGPGYAQGFVDGLREALNKVLGLVMQLFLSRPAQNGGNKADKPSGSGFLETASNLISFVKSGYSTAKDVFNTLKGGVSWLSNGWDSLKTGVSNAWQGVKSVGSNVAGFVKNLFF